MKGAAYDVFAVDRGREDAVLSLNTTPVHCHGVENVREDSLRVLLLLRPRLVLLLGVFDVSKFHPHLFLWPRRALTSSRGIRTSSEVRPVEIRHHSSG